jgi:hypothetical protein
MVLLKASLSRYPVYRQAVKVTHFTDKEPVPTVAVFSLGLGAPGENAGYEMRA